MTGARNITVTDILLGNRTPIKLGKGGYGFKLFRRPVGISEPTSELVDSDLSRQGTQSHVLSSSCQRATMSATTDPLTLHNDNPLHFCILITLSPVILVFMSVTFIRYQLF